MSDNPLGGGMPPGGGGPPQAGPQMINAPHVGTIERGENALATLHNYHKAVHTKVSNADRMLKVIRAEMEKLTAMADTVSPEDVIAAAGRVVGHGVPAKDMAQLLASMPAQAGQGLAAWISQQNQMVQQQEAEVARVREISAHRVALSAFENAAASDMTHRARQGALQMGPLAPGGNQAVASQPTEPPRGVPSPTTPPMMPISGPLAPRGS